MSWGLAVRLRTRAAALACCRRAQVGQVAVAAPAGVFHDQEVQVIDHQGFEKPLVAHSMMLPAHWRHQSEVKWLVPKPPCGVLAQLLLWAQSA